MNKKIGFIGCGNMGSAMIKGILNSPTKLVEDVLIYDVNTDLAETVAEETGATVVSSEKNVAKESDIIVLAVKPYVYPSVLETIKDDVDSEKTVAVIAVGVTFDDIYDALGDVKVVRIQPSTPALVGESDTTLLPDSKLSKEEIDYLIELLNTFGTTEILTEPLMDVVPSIASSAPAYALMLISAMADGGCLEGFPRDQAIRLSAQAVLGAAKLVLESGEDPDKLKNNICTPGGTTIEAVYSLEKNSFRGTVMEAVNECAKKSKRMLEK